MTAISLALCTFTFGYDALVIGNVLAIPAFVAQFSRSGSSNVLTATDVSILTAVPISGSAVGAIIVASVGDRYGRKKTLFLGCVLGLVGTALQTAAGSIAVFSVGRFISCKCWIHKGGTPRGTNSLNTADASTFILLAISVAFLNEIAPPAIRGTLGALGIVSVNLGGMVSAGVSLGTWKLTSSAAYRVPIGLQIMWPFIIALGVAYTMESPTSFLIHGDDARAELSLRKVRRGHSEQEIAVEMASLKAQQSLREADKEISWTWLFKGTNLRRTLLAAYVGNVQVLTGLFYSTSYATIFLTQVGSADPFLLVFGLSILSFGGAIAGLLVVDWMGRRTLALTSAAVILVIDLVIGVMGCLDLTVPAIGKTLAAFFLLFGFFFAAGVSHTSPFVGEVLTNPSPAHSLVPWSTSIQQRCRPHVCETRQVHLPSSSKTATVSSPSTFFPTSPTRMRKSTCSPFQTN